MNFGENSEDIRHPSFHQVNILKTHELISLRVQINLVKIHCINCECAKNTLHLYRHRVLLYQEELKAFSTVNAVSLLL